LPSPEVAGYITELVEETTESAGDTTEPIEYTTESSEETTEPSEEPLSDVFKNMKCVFSKI
jgi:hypothetical protein